MIRRLPALGLFVAVAACSGGGGGGGSPVLPSPSSPATTVPVATPTPVASPGATSTPVATPTPLYISESATSSDAFVDSIGINTHLNLPPYATSYAATNALIARLGVRHARDGMFSASGNNAPICAEEQMLQAGGVHFDYITDPTLGASDLTAWTSCVGPALEAYEGPNEYDIEHPQNDTNWPATVQAYQKTLYAAIKGNSSSAGVPVLGPTFTTVAAYQSVGNLGAYEDFGNMHAGFAGYNPGTTGYGPGGYGSINFNIANANIVGPGKPVIASETGYSTVSAASGVSPAIQGKYVPRLYLELFLHGVVRTYDYELCDEPSSNPYQAALGIVQQDLTPKPAYNALQSLIALLADPGPAFATSSLNYVVAGAPVDVHHVTLQKRDGSFYIAFWREDQSWNPNTLVPIAIAPVQLQITLSAAPASVVQYSYDTNSVLQPATLPATSTVLLTVTDSVSVLHLVPGSAGALSRGRR